MAISDKLQELLNIKQDIKETIENKGGDLTDVDFSGYAEKIDEIPLPKEEQEVTVDGFIFSSGDVVVTPSTGKVMTKVTVVKDEDLVPENIVKDVNIFGVVGTAETGGAPQSETWVINEIPDVSTNYSWDVNFTLLEQQWTYTNLSITMINFPDIQGIGLIANVSGEPMFTLSYGWVNQSFRTITFETAPTGDLLTWLQANAIKQ